jgi:hypothetical protein
MFNSFLKKIVPFFRQRGYSQTGQYCACASYIGRLRLHTHTHSNTYFPLQQWLQERASMLRYAYIACLTIHYNSASQPDCREHFLGAPRDAEIKNK